MWSISRSKINKKVGGNSHVRGSATKNVFPIFLWEGVKTLPTPNRFPWHSKRFGHFVPAPHLNNFAIALHAQEYGKIYPTSQGIIYPCKNSQTPPNFIS